MRNEQTTSALDLLQKSQEREQVMKRFGRYNFITRQLFQAINWLSIKHWSIITSCKRRIFKLLGYQELLCQMTKCNSCGSIKSMWRLGCHCDDRATVEHGWLLEKQKFLSLDEQQQSRKTYFYWVENNQFKIVRPRQKGS